MQSRAPGRARRRAGGLGKVSPDPTGSLLQLCRLFLTVEGPLGLHLDEGRRKPSNSPQVQKTLWALKPKP